MSSLKQEIDAVIEKSQQEMNKRGTFAFWVASPLLALAGVVTYSLSHDWILTLLIGMGVIQISIIVIGLIRANVKEDAEQQVSELLGQNKETLQRQDEARRKRAAERQAASRARAAERMS